MGFDCPLEVAFTFLYRAELEHGLTEHELDHVLVGRFAGEPHPVPSEVGDWRASSVPEIQSHLDANPSAYSTWFATALEGLVSRGHPRPEA